MIKLKDRSLVDSSVQNRLSDVQDVLADCYKKISEIEQHLPELMRIEPKNNGQRFQQSALLIEIGLVRLGIKLVSWHNKMQELG